MDFDPPHLARQMRINRKRSIESQIGEFIINASHNRIPELGRFVIKTVLYRTRKIFFQICEFESPVVVVVIVAIL